MYSAIIIDDQEEALVSISKMIAHFFYEDIKIIGTYTSAEYALISLSETEPDLIFMDIEMPYLNGIEAINLIPDNIKSKVIVISGKDQYAIKALKFNVFDYILKPVSLIEFKKCIDNLKAEDALIKVNQNEIKSNTIVIDSKFKTYFLEFPLINHIKSKSSHTLINIENQEQLVPRPIKYFEEILPKTLFFSPHRCHIVNFNFIKELRKSENGGTIMVLKDDTLIEMSKKKRVSFMTHFKYKF
jgi:two-component system, LytTR family, response regulator